MDRYLLPSHTITTQAHWDAMADILGEDKTVALYGDRPELTNTAECVARLYFNDRAPRRAVWAASILALVALGSVLFGAYRGSHADTRIDPCALVLTRESGPECR